MPSGHTPFHDVGGVSGTTVHKQGVDVPRSVDNKYPLTVLRIITCRGFYGGSQMAYVWDRDWNLLEPVSGLSYGTHYAGV